MQNVKQLEDVALACIPRAIVVRVLLTRIEDEGTVVEAVGDPVPLGVGDVVPPGAAVEAVRNAVAVGVEAIRDVGAGVRAVWHAILVSVGSVVLPWTAGPRRCEPDGGMNSPIPRMAARVSSTVLNGRGEMRVASRQRSLGG